MILECPRCDAIVEAEELFSYVDKDENEPVGKWTLAKCPKCTLPLLAVQVDDDDFDFATPNRVFPPQDKQLGFSVPAPLRAAYKEAVGCFRAKAFTASAIMCRKTLEGLCIAHGVKERGLAMSLKKLKQKGIIEEKLFEWAEALRTLGNEAAHGVSISISSQDAKDILEFTEALVEYVFTYRDRFEQFRQRRVRKPSSSTKRDASEKQGGVVEDA